MNMLSVPKGAELFFHFPYRKRDRFISTFVERRLNPELYLAASDLDSLDPGEFESIVATFRAYGALFTIHAPFFDLSPGGLDAKVRKATAERYAEIAAVAHRLPARTLVFHSGFDRFRFGGFEKTYIKNAAPIFRETARTLAHSGTRLAIENIYDTDPSFLVDLLDAIGETNVGLCLDVGHENIFSKLGAPAWIDRVGPHIVEMHAHDNHGIDDEHLPPGMGSIDFIALLDRFDRLDAGPTITFEMHSLDHIAQTLVRLGL